MAAAATPAPPSFIYLDSSSLHSLIPHSSLIPHFRSSLPSLSSSIFSPPRQHLSITNSNNNSNVNNSLLLMPSWCSHPSLPFIGLKAVTSFPSNSSIHNLPGIHAAYLLFSSITGSPLAALDGTTLTLLRTSAVSGLASLFLSRSNSSTLLIAGAGALSAYLAAAHCFVRPSINKILIWNRTVDKACNLALKLKQELKFNDDQVVVVKDIDEAVVAADIISCATGSHTPFIKGELLRPGTHLDLVGSFTPAMAECDDVALKRGRVFVDAEVAMQEAGELVGAFERGIMQQQDVVGSLPELVAGMKVGRTTDEEITVFKSVGTAVVDILAAQLAYETHTRGRGTSPQGAN